MNNIPNYIHTPTPSSQLIDDDMSQSSDCNGHTNTTHQSHHNHVNHNNSNRQSISMHGANMSNSNGNQASFATNFEPSHASVSSSAHHAHGAFPDLIHKYATRAHATNYASNTHMKRDKPPVAMNSSSSSKRSYSQLEDSNMSFQEERESETTNSNHDHTHACYQNNYYPHSHTDFASQMRSKRLRINQNVQLDGLSSLSSAANANRNTNRSTTRQPPQHHHHHQSLVIPSSNHGSLLPPQNQQTLKESDSDVALDDVMTHDFGHNHERLSTVSIDELERSVTTSIATNTTSTMTATTWATESSAISTTQDTYGNVNRILGDLHLARKANQLHRSRQDQQPHEQHQQQHQQCFTNQVHSQNMQHYHDHPRPYPPLPPQQQPPTTTSSLASMQYAPNRKRNMRQVRLQSDSNLL